MFHNVKGTTASDCDIQCILKVLKHGENNLQQKDEEINVFFFFLALTSSLNKNNSFGRSQTSDFHSTCHLRDATTCMKAMTIFVFRDRIWQSSQNTCVDACDTEMLTFLVVFKR